jgi:hypothetical protein
MKTERTTTETITYTITAKKVQGKWVGQGNGIHLTRWYKNKGMAIMQARATVLRNGEAVSR